MAASGGACAFILNLKPKNTISTFANWPVDAVIDDNVVGGLLIKHKSGIKLLPAPTTLEESELVTSTTINMIWPFLQSNSAYLIVDAGSRFSEPVIPILERSDIILLLLAPELVSVKAAYDAMQIFEKFNIDPSKILLVVNNIFPEHPLPLEKIAAGLKKDISATIPYDGNAFIQNLNTGYPIILAAPRSEASLAILSLAYKLSSKEMESDKITRPSPFLETIRKIFTAS